MQNFKMPRTIYHLHIKTTAQDFYYGSVKAITDHQKHDTLGVGRDWLYRHDWVKPFENEKIKIKKSELLTTVDVKS